MSAARTTWAQQRLEELVSAFKVAASSRQIRTNYQTFFPSLTVGNAIRIQGSENNNQPLLDLQGVFTVYPDGRIANNPVIDQLLASKPEVSAPQVVTLTAPPPPVVTSFAGAMIGDFRWSVIDNDHAGWLLCDGRSVDKNRYPQLFDLVGFRFGGSGDTFALPDARDRVCGVTGTSHWTGEAVGQEEVTLTEDQIAAHSHTGVTQSSGGHSHAYANAVTVLAPTGDEGSNWGGGTASHTELRWRGRDNGFLGNEKPLELPTSNGGQHVHAFKTQASTGGQPHPNMQPTLFIGNLFIYTGVVDLE